MSGEQDGGMWTREDFASVRLFALQVANKTHQMLRCTSTLRYAIRPEAPAEESLGRPQCLAMVADLERLYDYWRRHNPLDVDLIEPLSTNLPKIREGLNGDMLVLRKAIADGDDLVFRFLEQVDRIAVAHCPQEYFTDPLPEL